LTLKHFQKPFTFRLEWQPGRGGRLDWFLRDRSSDRNATITAGSHDGFEHIFGLKDASLKDLMGSQIPIEPMGIIFNVAVSSTWGFPYDTPDWCPKCYDCDDPKCACSFYPGFCQMIRSNNTAMYIDFVRVYQSSNPDAHVGANHTLGCDPPAYPTKEWIHGHTYRYMRNPPFSYEDKHPIRPVQRGGGPCKTDNDCGGDVHSINFTAVMEEQNESDRNLNKEKSKNIVAGRGQCVEHLQKGMFSMTTEIGMVCSCNDGYTGPFCLSLDHIDESPSAYKIRTNIALFRRMHYFVIPNVMSMFAIFLLILLWALLWVRIRDQKLERLKSKVTLHEPARQRQQHASPGNGPIILNANSVGGSSAGYMTSTTGTKYSAIR
jgi:Beta-glucan synthesis-associated protein SKN1/KRE6/Sbg1